MKPVYNIATAADSKYYIPMYVMLYSLFKHHTGLHFHVYILQKDMDNSQRVPFEELAKKYGHAVSWLQIPGSTVDAYYTSAHISTAAYYRIFLPGLLPADVQAVLYIDADVLIRNNVQELLDTDMKQVPLMAVKEPIPYKIERLGIPAEYDYFNSGLLWMNIAEWRKNNYEQQLLKNIEQNGANYLMHDQDALNTLFYDKVVFLDPKWNHQTGFYHLTPEQLETRYQCNAHELLNDAPVIHFVGQYKPWLYICTHPFKSLFLQYLNETRFADFAEKPSISLMINKTSKRIKHKLKKILHL